MTIQEFHTRMQQDEALDPYRRVSQHENHDALMAADDSVVQLGWGFWATVDRD